MRPAPVPSGDPQFRDDAHLTIRRPDKRHPETQDGLIDGGVRPAPRLAVLGTQDVGSSELSVIDAEPAQVIDRREKVDVVLLVGGDEYCIQCQAAVRFISVSVSVTRMLVPTRRKEERAHLACRSENPTRTCLPAASIVLLLGHSADPPGTTTGGERRTYEPRRARITDCPNEFCSP